MFGRLARYENVNDGERLGHDSVADQAPLMSDIPEQRREVGRRGMSGLGPGCVWQGGQA